MITWAEIEQEAEATGYKERLVEIFRKYEGQRTDEKDGQGNTVTVTVGSFARHMGIPPSTFRNWAENTARVVSEDHRARMEKERARRAVRTDPQTVAREIANLPDEQRTEILDAVTDAVYGQGAARQRDQSWDNDRTIRKQYAEDQERNGGLELESKGKIIFDELSRTEQWYHFSRLLDYGKGVFDSHSAADLVPEMFK